MAETILSPGVFTNEKDLSFLPTGIAQIGAAVVGPTIKGPAFIPTIIESYNDFVATFGDTTTESYVPYTVKEYLKNAGRVTVVRTLFENGYKMDAPLGIVVSGSYGKRLVAVLHPTQKITDTDAFDYTNPTVSLFEKSLVANSTTTSGSFVLTISGSSLIPYGSTILSASLVSTSPISASLAADANTRVEVVTGSTDSWNFSNDALSASTPYITSQQTSGNTTKNLFKFHTLSDGNAVNYEVKIGITDVRPAGTVPGSNYGSFTVVVRARFRF